MSVILITDDAGRSAGQLSHIVQQAILGGVTAVQLREKRASARQLESMRRKLLAVCRDSGVPLILNASLLSRFEQPIEADGIHWGAASVVAQTGVGDLDSPETGIRLPASFGFPETTARALGLGDSRRLISGYSAHSFLEARTVLARCADNITLSPIYETPSKQGVIPACGTGVIAVTRTQLPDSVITGLGGIDETNAADVIRAGADRVAVIRAIMESTDPAGAARRLRSTVDSALAERQG